ncbi:MAG: carboxylating nicotinate-nucleotide diphosphorylase [Bacteroidetes bacterium]|nr:carboxylating nicotinate-nucleotide diphosphorylase [Bacteroidota bacterium]MBS1630139.1 carboxylating nicotinate-nucleotide diphosphorylase [Bacteroidota bacterium]
MPACFGEKNFHNTFADLFQLQFFKKNRSVLNRIEFIQAALAEDLGQGDDYSSLASIPATARGKAALKIKEEGILAGVALAQEIFRQLEPEASIQVMKQDGEPMYRGETAFEVTAHVHTILKAERLALNCMQRMSGIATLTARYVEKLKGYKTKILDTRKTTPLFRAWEKEAVRIGGGFNHRMGLYDMVMLKDNHIDYAGGIRNAILQTNDYLRNHHLDLNIEIETRSLADVQEVLATGQVHRIMLDNFQAQDIEAAVRLIDGKYETEASGGITLDNIVDYARGGVDYISVGAIIHHAVSLDLSLKAI